MAFNIMEDFFDPGPIYQWLWNYGQSRWWVAQKPITVNPVKEDENIRWVKYEGIKRPVYNLFPDLGKRRTESLRLWYLPYFDDTAQYTILDPAQATIMVTAPMSGCTFGAGTSTIKGEMIVTHTNNASAPNQTTQRSMQAAAARSIIRQEGAHLHQGSLKPKLVEPKHYRPNRDTEILLFGIYSDGKSGWFNKGGGKKWRFYKHVYTRVSEDGQYTQLKVAERIFRIR